MVTDVSGRGVGMDVVKRNIEALRGSVTINSTEGVGSVFTIMLPLTLAIIDGMVVKVRDNRYIIPTLSVVRSLRPTKTEVETVIEKGEMLSLDDGLVRLIRLSGLFVEEQEVDKIDESLVVLVESDGNRAGLVVDNLLGKQQIVIKSLGESLKNIDGISGGAIMPDGRVGLILDVAGLVKAANEDPANTVSESALA